MMSSNENSLEQFELYVKKLQEENDKLKEKVLSEEVSRDPSALHLHESLDILLHNKMKLQSDIEALLNNDLKLLPDDDDILINLAKEKAQLSVNDTARTLASQIELNKKLTQEVADLEDMFKKAEAVDKHLEDLIKNTGEKNEFALLQHKYNKCGTFFQELREELNWYLSTRFDDGENRGNLCMDNILEMLTNRFFEDPNNPYVYFKEDVESKMMNYLISSHIVLRHPTDPFRYKLADFRLN